MRDDGATADPPIAHAKVQTLAAAKRRATPTLLIDMIASIHGDLSITLGTLDSVRYRECEVRHITKRMKTESKKYRTRFVRLDAPGTFYDRRSRPQSSSASRFTAGAAGFLNLSQSRVRSLTYGEPRRASVKLIS